jgi:hypothetical protein
MGILRTFCKERINGLPGLILEPRCSLLCGEVHDLLVCGGAVGFGVLPRRQADPAVPALFEQATISNEEAGWSLYCKERDQVAVFSHGFEIPNNERPHAVFSSFGEGVPTMDAPLRSGRREGSAVTFAATSESETAFAPSAIAADLQQCHDSSTPKKPRIFSMI